MKTALMVEERRMPVAEGKARRTWTLTEEVLAELEAWRAAQRPIPTESQAVDELLRQALTLWREDQKQPKPAKPRN